MVRYKRGAGKTAMPGFDYAALAEFRYQIRRFLRFSEEAARAAGVEPQQHQLLLAAKGAGDQPPTVRAIAERLQIQHHSAVELIDRTERRGLVRRVRQAGDRRRVMVELTPKGEKTLRVLTLHHREALSESAPELVATLDRLVSSLGQAGKRDAAGRRR